MNQPAIFKPARAQEWTSERIGRLTVSEIRQLRENAQRLNEAAVVALCSEALTSRPKARTAAAAHAGASTMPRRLIARRKAFEARGVWLQDARTSWSGIRKSDGVVVIALWANALEPSERGWACLLWAPNADGARPWSDQAAGKERREHCERALELGGAEGLLVYGVSLNGHPPQAQAHSVRGVDPETVLRLTVEKRGAEFWAKWG
jgi:hypothetical protein